MKQLQFYKYATWILLMLNLAIVTFFFVNRPPGPPRGGSHPPQKAIDVLDLDKKQHRLFLASVKAHEEQLDALSEKQQVELLPYFKSILVESDTTNFDSTLIRVQALERAKIESLFQHFQDIKSLLRADQKAAFTVFIENIVEKNLLKPKKNQHPPIDPAH